MSMALQIITRRINERIMIIVSAGPLMSKMSTSKGTPSSIAKNKIGKWLKSFTELLSFYGCNLRKVESLVLDLPGCVEDGDTGIRLGQRARRGIRRVSPQVVVG